MSAATFRAVLEALDRLGIEYLVGGSVASSVYGIYRASMDVDLVAALAPWHAPLLAAELGAEFYVDVDMIVDALEANRSFNLIHYRSGDKFDVFPFRDGDAFMESQFARRQIVEQGELRFPAASPEDIILSKLLWYRAGGSVSRQQWHDVLGVIAVQGDRLDVSYLRSWAARLGVAELLAEALVEAAKSQ
jgi:hypothetical protein